MYDLKRLFSRLFCRFVLGEAPGKIAAWEALGNKACFNLDFKKNYSIGDSVFDFYCPDIHLAIDVFCGHISYWQFRQKKYIIIRHDLNYIPAIDSDVACNINMLLSEISIYKNKHVYSYAYLAKGGIV